MRPLALFYFTTFSALGIYLPYFGLYAESLGFSGWQIGALAAAFPLGKLAFGPLWALWSDRVGRRREIAVLGVAAATLTFATLLPVRTFLPMCAVLYLYAAFLSPQLPLVESTTLELAERRGWQYGRIRVWGSLGFVVAALGFGPVFDRVPIRFVVHAVVAALLVNLVATAFVPRSRPATRWRRGDLRPALLRPAVWAFLVCGLLMQASHGGYFAFFSIVLDDAGFPRVAIGALWALGVVAEMVTMIASGWLLRRFGVPAVMTGCLLLAALRWTVFAQTTWLPAVILAQLLHAFSFGAFHVAAVTGTYRLFPEALRSSGQSLFSGFTYGAGNALGFFAAGLLFDRGGPAWLFGASAAMALAATALSTTLWREPQLLSARPAPVALPLAEGGVE